MLRTEMFAAALAACVTGAIGHGYMAKPGARNGNHNGMVGGGPGTVYSGGVMENYKHGMCGDAPGTTQNMNAAGPIKATYTAGDTVEIQLTITAHHGGWFEFDICDDASDLSEQCFAKYRLIKPDCQCQCPSNTVGENNCAECFGCRRYWKPLISSLTNLYFARGYTEQGSLVLPTRGGNTYTWTYTVFYKIPAGLKSQHAVLRWHWLTANSCTSHYSAPEEFWNCADIAITGADGDMGPPITVDDDAMMSMPVNNLVPEINSGALQGLDWQCTKDTGGNLQSIGSAADYFGACGKEVGLNEWEFCKEGTPSSNPPITDPDEGGGSPGSDPQCDNSIWPIGATKCQEECGPAYVECVNSQQVVFFCPQDSPVCKDDRCVSESFCPTPAPPPPGATPQPTEAAACAALPNSNGCTDVLCAQCLSGYQWWPCNVQPACCSCVGNSVPAPPPTAPPPPASEVCGACVGCLWGNTGVCYTDVTDATHCLQWPGNTFCPGGSSATRLYDARVPGALEGLQQKYGSLGPKPIDEPPSKNVPVEMLRNPISFGNTGWIFLAEWSNDAHTLQPEGGGANLWSVERPGVQIVGTPFHWAPALNAINASDPGFIRFGSTVEAVRVGNGWVGVLDKASPCTNTCAEYGGKYCFAAIFSDPELGPSDSNDPDVAMSCEKRQGLVAYKCPACGECNPCDVVHPDLQKGLSELKPSSVAAPSRLNEVHAGGRPLAVASENAAGTEHPEHPEESAHPAWLAPHAPSAAVGVLVGVLAGALGHRALSSAARARHGQLSSVPPTAEAAGAEAGTSDTAEA